MNDTSRQILSINKSASAQIAKFCRLRSRFCKILSIKTLFKLKQGIKYTLFKFTKSFDSGLNMSFFDEFSPLSVSSNFASADFRKIKTYNFQKSESY